MWFLAQRQVGNHHFRAGRFVCQLSFEVAQLVGIRMMNQAVFHTDTGAECKKHALVLCKTTFREEKVLAVRIDFHHRVLLVADEVTVFEYHFLRIEKLQDAIRAVADNAIVHAYVLTVFGYQTVSTASVQVSIGNVGLGAILEPYHTSGTISFLGVSHGEVLKLDVLAVHEVKDESIGRIDHDV